MFPFFLLKPQRVSASEGLNSFLVLAVGKHMTEQSQNHYNGFVVLKE